MAESVIINDSAYDSLSFNTSSLQCSLEEFDSHQESGFMLNDPILNDGDVLLEEMVMPTQEQFNMEVREGQALTSTDPEKLLEERLNKIKYQTKRLSRTF